MGQQVYAPMNGKEVREVKKRRICEEIDKIPGLKVGLAFKKVQIDVGFTIRCYPDDVPCPEGEFGFVTESEASVMGFFENHYNEVDELESKIIKLREQHESLTKLLEEGEKALSSVLVIEEVIIHESSALDTNSDTPDTPDKLRVKVGLPVPTIEQVGLGRERVEVFSQPNKTVGTINRI